MIEIKILKEKKKYTFFLFQNNIEIGTLICEVKNSNKVFSEIGFENFSLDDNNSDKNKYNTIEQILKDNKKSIKIDTLNINSKYRKMGHGETLLKKSLEYIEKTLKIKFIYLEVLPFDKETKLALNKEDLIKFYEKTKFQILKDNKYKFLMFRDNDFMKINKDIKHNIENLEFENDIIEELLNDKNLESLEDRYNDDESLNYY
jgi:ribosomal protein S18 acetylase RimI-like enzyme